MVVIIVPGSTKETKLNKHPVRAKRSLQYLHDTLECILQLFFGKETLLKDSVDPSRALMLKAFVQGVGGLCPNKERPSYKHHN